MKKIIVLLLSLAPVAVQANSYEWPVKSRYCREFSYCKYVIESSERYNLDPALVMSVLLHESGGGRNPYVKGKRVYVRLKYGRSGYYRAQGLMQVMPFNFGRIPKWKWLIPSVNIDRGAYLLSRCKKKYYPNFVKMVSCYNMGEYNKRINYSYVRKVAAVYSRLKARK